MMDMEKQSERGAIVSIMKGGAEDSCLIAARRLTFPNMIIKLLLNYLLSVPTLVALFMKAPGPVGMVYLSAPYHDYFMKRNGEFFGRPHMPQKPYTL